MVYPIFHRRLFYKQYISKNSSLINSRGTLIRRQVRNMNATAKEIKRAWYLIYFIPTKRNSGKLQKDKQTDNPQTLKLCKRVLSFQSIKRAVSESFTGIQKLHAPPPPALQRGQYNPIAH